MPDSSTEVEEDFSAQLQALVAEAEKKIVGSERRPAVRPASGAGVAQKLERAGTQGDARKGDSIADTLKELATGVKQLQAGQEANTKSIERIEGAGSDRETLSKLVGEARLVIEQKNTLSKVMFDALYGELKGYKDSFILESMMKPVIRDIISLYDGTCELGRQMVAAIGEAADESEVGGPKAVLQAAVETINNNVEHHAHFALEVLERLDVTLMPLRDGKLDKLSQRAIAVESAEAPEEDQMVVKVLKRGFVWRDRVIRPEEVVIKKWIEGYLIAIDSNEPE